MNYRVSTHKLDECTTLKEEINSFKIAEELEADLFSSQFNTEFESVVQNYLILSNLRSENIIPAPLLVNLCDLNESGHSIIHEEFFILDVLVLRTQIVKNNVNLRTIFEMS